jgi:hypothetical protein
VLADGAGAREAVGGGGFGPGPGVPRRCLRPGAAGGRVGGRGGGGGGARRRGRGAAAGGGRPARVVQLHREPGGRQPDPGVPLPDFRGVLRAVPRAHLQPRGAGVPGHRPAQPLRGAPHPGGGELAGGPPARRAGDHGRHGSPPVATHQHRVPRLRAAGGRGPQAGDPLRPQPRAGPLRHHRGDAEAGRCPGGRPVAVPGPARDGDLPHPDGGRAAPDRGLRGGVTGASRVHRGAPVRTRRGPEPPVDRPGPRGGALARVHRGVDQHRHRPRPGGQL